MLHAGGHQCFVFWRYERCLAFVQSDQFAPLLLACLLLLYVCSTLPVEKDGVCQKDHFQLFRAGGVQQAVASDGSYRGCSCQHLLVRHCEAGEMKTGKRSMPGLYAEGGITLGGG